jgi:hypothetical protein
MSKESPRLEEVYRVKWIAEWFSENDFMRQINQILVTHSLDFVFTSSALLRTKHGFAFHALIIVRFMRLIAFLNLNNSFIIKLI